MIYTPWAEYFFAFRTNLQWIHGKYDQAGKPQELTCMYPVNIISWNFYHYAQFCSTTVHI